MEVMRVEFTKHEKNGRVACAWTATRGKRTEVPGSYMPAGKDIPHDLGQYVVEAATGYADGFWGLIDRGAARRPVPVGRSSATIAPSSTRPKASPEHTLLRGVLARSPT